MIFRPALFRACVCSGHFCPDFGIALANCTWVVDSPWGAGFCLSADLSLGPIPLVILSKGLLSTSMDASRHCSSKPVVKGVGFIQLACTYWPALWPVDCFIFVESILDSAILLLSFIHYWQIIGEFTVWRQYPSLANAARARQTGTWVEYSCGLFLHEKWK